MMAVYSGFLYDPLNQSKMIKKSEGMAEELFCTFNPTVITENI